MMPFVVAAREVEEPGLRPVRPPQPSTPPPLCIVATTNESLAESVVAMLLMIDSRLGPAMVWDGNSHSHNNDYHGYPMVTEPAIRPQSLSLFDYAGEDPAFATAATMQEDVEM
eukprot:jgi/Hompol1/4281/HPOL_007069-RA